MASTTYTLDKFGVPIDGARQGPLKQPKIKHRFRVRFLNFGAVANTAQDLTLNLESSTLPTISHEEVAVHSYNSIAYYAGKASFNTVDLVVRDDVSNTATKNIGAQEQLQLDHYNQTGYRSATNYKFTTLIEVMDGGNTAVLEQWTLEGCWLVSSNYGDLNYSSSESKTISMTIRYDNATYVDENGNTLMATPSADPQGSTL
jgi:hypothetical protein